VLTVADAQAWLDDPAANFGWMLVGQNETVDFTARRFGSREDVIQAPRLRIEFIPPPSISSAQVLGTNFVVQFTVPVGRSCALEARDTLKSGPEWLEITNVPAPPEAIPITILDPLMGQQRFYRLRLP